MDIAVYFRLLGKLIAERGMRNAFIVFFIFSLVYVFLLCDKSFYSLSGDNLNIAAFIFSELHPDIFGTDTNNPRPVDYYLPLFTEPVKWLYWLCGSYVLTLQIITAFYMFCSLSIMTLSLKSILRSLSPAYCAVFAFVFCMPVLSVPSTELWGFGGLYAAVGRNSFFMFIPLMVSMLYKKVSVHLPFIRLNCESIVLILIGILFPLHPISGACTAVVVCAWTLLTLVSELRTARQLVRTLAVLFCSLAVFIAIASLVYVIPLVKLQNKAASEKVMDNFSKPNAAPVFKTSVPVVPLMQMPLAKKELSITYTLKVLLFIPALFGFLYLFFFRDLASDARERRLWKFSLLFLLAAYLSVLAAFFIFENIEYSTLLYPAKRMDRMLLFASGFAAIVTAYLVIKHVRSSLWKYSILFVLFVAWISLSKTRGMIYFCAWKDYIPLLCKLDVMLLSYLLNIGVAAAALLAVLMKRSHPEHRNLWTVMLAVPILFWCLASGGFVTAVICANDALGSKPRIFVERCLGIKRTCIVSQFEDATAEMRRISAHSDRVLYIDSTMSQHMKFASMRNGLCWEFDEIGLLPEKREQIKLFRQFWRAGNIMEVRKIIDANSITYVMAGGGFRTDSGEIAGIKAATIYKNTYYSIYQLK